MTTAKENGDSCTFQKMYFVEFLEMICRVADIKSKLETWIKICFTRMLESYWMNCLFYWANNVKEENFQLLFKINLRLILTIDDYIY